MPFLAILTLIITVLTATTGCAATRATPSSTISHELSLTFFVQGLDASANPLEQTSRYVVLSDRTLHVVLGPAARDRTYPKPYRRLSVDEYDRLIRFVDDHHLLAEPTSPGAAAAGTRPRYEVALTRGGRTNRYATTPAESPPTTALLAALAAFRGADLNRATMPR